MTSSRAIKRVGQWALAHGGAPALARWARRDDLLVLTYHNVVADRACAARGEASLHIDRDTFAAQLDLLRESHDVVSLTDVLNGRRGRGDRPRAMITFDDAYRGAVTLGVQELSKRRMVATIFVAPAFVGGRIFWWDALAGAAGGELPSTVRDTALRTLRGADDRVRRWAGAAGLPMAEPSADLRCATLGELRAASHVPGITFGAHTWSHPVLPSIAADELTAELLRPLAWLRERLGSVIPALAVPYGISSARVEAEARVHGYAAVFPGGRGWVSPRAPLPFALPRLNVPSGIPRSAFILRSAGMPA